MNLENRIKQLQEDEKLWEEKKTNSKKMFDQIIQDNASLEKKIEVLENLK